MGTLETRHKVDTYHRRYSSPYISCADNTLEVPLLWCITVREGILTHRWVLVEGVTVGVQIGPGGLSSIFLGTFLRGSDLRVSEIILLPSWHLTQISY